MAQHQDPQQEPHVGQQRPDETSGKDPGDAGALSRRSFLKGAGGGVVAGALTGGLAPQALATPPAKPAQDGPATRSGRFELTLEINGESRTVQVQPRSTLLHTLRHHLEPALTGTKEVCAQGNCGACTVMVDGRPVYSCLQLATDMEGRSIRTVEGLGTPEDLSPVQAAFCEHDALMCGFCTPGFVVASTACLEKHGAPDEETVKKELSGNVCRCGTYPHIFEAVQTAAKGGK